MIVWEFGCGLNAKEWMYEHNKNHANKTILLCYSQRVYLVSLGCRTTRFMVDGELVVRPDWPDQKGTFCPGGGLVHTGPDRRSL